MSEIETREEEGGERLETHFSHFFRWNRSLSAQSAVAAERNQIFLILFSFLAASRSNKSPGSVPHILIPRFMKSEEPQTKELSVMIRPLSGARSSI